MSLYKYAANQLLHVVNSHQNGDYFNFLGYEGFRYEYRRNYAGIMANIHPNYRDRARNKQGLFDVRGNMNGVVLTHNQLLGNLLYYSDLNNCITVWQGEIPECRSQGEFNALVSLAMLMFEQEINFGNEIFQRKSHFSPDFYEPNFRRPRDLLMGYINYMFDNNNVECLWPFENRRGQLLPPVSGSNIKTIFFDCFINNFNANALMTRDYENYNLFSNIAIESPDNPNL